MIKRRAFLGGALTAMSAGTLRAPSATAQAVIPAPAEPLVWPVVTKLPPGIRSFAGHTDTVPDVVGRIGTPAGLVIFSEGNHLMALLSDDILGAFGTLKREAHNHRSWRRKIRFLLVMTSPTGTSVRVSNRRSRLVRMPTSRLPCVTGTPEIL